MNYKMTIRIKEYDYHLRSKLYIRWRIFIKKKLFSKYEEIYNYDGNWFISPAHAIKFLEQYYPQINKEKGYKIEYSTYNGC